MRKGVSLSRIYLDTDQYVYPLIYPLSAYSLENKIIAAAEMSVENRDVPKFFSLLRLWCTFS